MSENSEDFKNKIRLLEAQLAQKNSELARYQHELGKANSTLETLISDMHQELKAAQALQRFLSPTELPNISGFEFSTKFIAGTKSGGDYFDIFEHEDKLKFGILLACSSGYTMSALLLSVVIKVSSQIEARRGLSADKVMRLLIKEIQPLIQNKDKASLFYGVIDRRSFELEYSAVGTIDGFIWPHGADGPEEIKTCASPLSRDFSSEVFSVREQLNPQDHLILATEGLRGTENSDGQMWGLNGLKAALKKSPKRGVHEIRNEILYGNEQFSGRIEPIRDQTLLVVEVKEKVIKLASR